MDEKLKRAGDQFSHRHPGASRVLRGIIDVSCEEPQYSGAVLRTGILSLDMALGGGLPSGVVELHGDESTGKTALMGSILAAAQRANRATALCPSEYLDQPYLETLGVDLNKLALIKGSLDGVHPVMCDFVKSPDRVVAVDSLTALRPEDESPENWNWHVFQFLSGIRHFCGPGSLMMVTNQSRVRRSIHPGRTLARGTETAARRFTDLFDVRLELGRDRVSRDEYTMVVNIEANVLSKPAVIVELPVKKGHGVQASLDTLRVALEHGAVEQAGSRYYIGGEELGHGEKDAAATLHLSGLMWKLQDALLR
jgi:archaellum biogenesis ATPase FlaH